MARDFGVLCLLAALFLMIFAYRNQVDDMRAVIYKRCMERQTYDNSSNELRNEMAKEFRAFAEQERTNPFIDDTLRNKRMTSWNSLATSAEATVKNQVHSSCNAYR